MSQETSLGNYIFDGRGLRTTKDGRITLMTPEEKQRTDEALKVLAEEEKRLREGISGENLERMRNTEEGGMEACLMGESMGGNAGFYKGLPCGGANFRYNERTGLILCFGNIQDLPRDIISISADGTFRVPVDSGSNSPVGVSEVYLEGNPSENAEKVIRETVERYNHQCGGRIEDPVFKIIRQG